MSESIKFDGKVPKTLRDFATKNRQKVSEITGKGVLYDDAYDVSYRPGWKSSSDPVGSLHSDYHENVKGLMSLIRESMPCDCAECRMDLTTLII